MTAALPWLIRYSEDLLAKSRYGADSARTVLRPFLEVSLVHELAMDQKVLGLIDSGSEHTLAAPQLARAIRADLRGAFECIPLGIGGEDYEARFLDVTIRIHRRGAPMDEFIEWQAPVGFLNRQPKRAGWSVLLGQVGFLDRFTVTMHRNARTIAIEPIEAFDERFPPTLEADLEVPPPRFVP